MRNLSRAAMTAAALALAGGSILAASAVPAAAHDVRVRVGVNSGYSYYGRPYHYRYNPGYYGYRPAYRYRYHQRPYYRWRDNARRDFLNCRWVPGEGRVCW